MYVNNLKLNNYRNYESLDIEFKKGINIIYGNNAQGKTNILEAIYYCATARSHRTNYDKDLILWGQNEGHINLEVQKKNNEIIDIHFRKSGKKGIAVNKYPIQKLNQLYGTLNVILFSPEDLSLVKKGPSERRKFIDIELCQIDKIYLYNLQQYHKVLKQRNNLLKAVAYGKGDKATIEIWDEQLITFGSKLIKARYDFINELKNYVMEIHEQITNGKEKLIIKYEKNCEEQYFSNLLKKNVDKDIKFGNTSIGPHRDDLAFRVNDIDLRTFGSQGQHRTAALSLKLAEIDLIKQKTNDLPVLLLDDVLSELDDSRQKHLLSTLENIQTIVTCTGVEDFIHKGMEVDRMIKISSGVAEIVK
ncbi:DNA replication/repair protein RecF [Vallitalea okinawensis]|uniref:DNA replication/repair protein RecF n=1 Tax=Vallitalea okinawensis TaxID=2078660 RepID=UPI000CFAC94E|nr:DNA replication/repair protein RecF [Vallitalea okinawensis]